MINKIYELSDQDFTELIKNSTCIKEVLFKLGYSTVGNSWGYSKVKERMQSLGLEAKDFKGRNAIFDKQEKQIPAEELFTENNKHARRQVRTRILKEKLIPYKCAICGIDEWQGKKLALELDHINGKNNDHRLENLRFLCPNCHSQTSTYGSKNRDISQVDYEITPELEKDVLEAYNKLGNMKKVSSELQVRLPVVKQIINNNGLSKSNLKFVIRYDKDMNEIKRYGSISEACQSIIDNNECKTKILKTCRATFMRNVDKFWLNSYWRIMDA